MLLRIHAPNISSSYHCLAKLLDAIGEEGTGKEILGKFGNQVLDICRVKIRESLLEDEYEDAERLAAREASLIRMVVTIGEIVQFSPRLMPAGLRHFDALKTVLASDIFQEEDLPVVNFAMPSVNPSPSTSRAPSPAHPFLSFLRAVKDPHNQRRLLLKGRLSRVDQSSLNTSLKTQ
ncbi:unnamed protein product [Strongylus vulgaris]|uniref:Uncharacterized protein n=1 Tax=Strongylus vulgaris TaxID=40348 RepID=A0A3P7IRY6_STRVU|nr:unnamed protein product [Strongylus vulgaris]